MTEVAGIDIIQVVGVAIAFAATYLVARIVTRSLSRIFERTPFPENIEKGIVKVSKYIVYVVGFFVIVSVLGVDPTSVIVGLGAFSIALSFAMSNIIQNLVSGVLVQADHVFKIGDEIKVQAYEGKVVKMSVRTTIMETKDGDVVYIPNSIFATNPVLRKRQTTRQT
ncbi:MAG: mechanosensitive ion channel family protein [Candidatus Bathycorpusculaceae bacterium]